MMSRYFSILNAKPGQLYQSKPFRRLSALALLCFLSLLCLGVWHLTGCAPPGKDRRIPQVKLTIQNTLPIKRDNVPITLSLAELRRVAPNFSFDAYLVVSGEPPREIASQADDTNYDGAKDQLFFLVNLEPQETKEISIRYSPDNQMAVTLGFTRRVRAGVFPELRGVAALESEAMAYLFNANGNIQAYGKKLKPLFSVESVMQSDLDFNTTPPPNWRQVFEEHNISLSPNSQIEVGKRESRWAIKDPDKKQEFFIRKAEKTLDVYKSKGLLLNRFALQPSDDLMTQLISAEGFGAGGFAIWDTVEREFTPIDGVRDYVRIIADGPARAVVQRIIPGLSAQADDGNASLISTISIVGGNHWAEHRLQVKGLNERYRVAVGILNQNLEPGKDEKEGLLWAWDERGIGFGVIYPKAQFSGFQELRNAGYAALLKPDENGEAVYHFTAVWKESQADIETREAFEQHMQVTAKAIQTPPVIKLMEPKES
jgi:hypothetical protein